ncbi:thiol:disulfide interchange protein DsbA/DsbL [Parashewanella tropica]|uniref:thiol:disulfide interchange protein DsbA/DsbL n=1 Tax=Parashewanella tropica TaxID=2547970 RepID=UPI001FE3547E|nr:thiol:disulfide interchange protein DsbA/DsbL [Parashewanella tropica]
MIKKLYASIFICAFSFLCNQALAANYVEGKDYTKVEGFPETHKPVVREFFSYNCPHCYHAEPSVEKMATMLKGKVAFVRTPVGAGRPSWILGQEAYYVAQKLRITNQVHSQIFHYIHEEAGPFTSASQLRAFFITQGVKGAEFDKVYNSPEKKSAFSEYGIQVQLSGISGVPTFLINGIYEVNPSGKSASELVAIVNYLVKLKPKK